MIIPLKFLEYKSRDTVPLKSGCHAGALDAGALSGPILEKETKHNDLLTVCLFQVKARKCTYRYCRLFVLVKMYRVRNRFICPIKF